MCKSGWKKELEVGKVEFLVDKTWRRPTLWIFVSEWEGGVFSFFLIGC